MRKLLLGFWILAAGHLQAGTGVLNGGDGLVIKLSYIRMVLAQTLAHGKEADRIPCSYTDPVEQTFCEEYFKTVGLSGMVAKALDDTLVPFEVVVDPILVLGADGVEHEVAAATYLEVDGKILFHKDSVISASPAKLLSLVTHEIIHKVPFRGKFVSDHEPFGPFERGEPFINHLANNITMMAQEFSLLRDELFIEEIFTCRVAYGQAVRSGDVTATREYDQNDSLHSRYSVKFGDKNSLVKLGMADSSGVDHWFSVRIEGSDSFCPEFAQVNIDFFVQDQESPSESTLLAINPINGEKNSFEVSTRNGFGLFCRHRGSYVPL